MLNSNFGHFTELQLYYTATGTPFFCILAEVRTKPHNDGMRCSMSQEYDIIKNIELCNQILTMFSLRVYLPSLNLFGTLGEYVTHQNQHTQPVELTYILADMQIGYTIRPMSPYFIILVFKTHRLKGVTSFSLQPSAFYVVINKLIVVK